MRVSLGTRAASNPYPAAQGPRALTGFRFEAFGNVGLRMWSQHLGGATSSFRKCLARGANREPSNQSLMLLMGSSGALARIGGFHTCKCLILSWRGARPGTSHLIPIAVPPDWRSIRLQQASRGFRSYKVLFRYLTFRAPPQKPLKS